MGLHPRIDFFITVWTWTMSAICKGSDHCKFTHADTEQYVSFFSLEGASILERYIFRKKQRDRALALRIQDTAWKDVYRSAHTPAADSVFGKSEGQTELLVDQVDIERKPRAFVCLTGQLGRLELKHKIKNMFEPLALKFAVDVALVLDNSTTDIKWTNHMKGIHEATATTSSPKPEYSTMGAAEALLQSHSSVANVVSLGYTQVADPVVSEQYLSMLNNPTSMHSARLRRRAENHVRQFEALALCFTAMRAQEKAFKGKYGSQGSV
jgi:hypothetical protein